MSRELTPEEVRERFLRHVNGLVDYWDKVEKDTTKEKLRGLAFSILGTLDGCSGDIPGFIVVPCPHPDDREWHMERDEDWWPENNEPDVICDIGGSLHELFHR
jgi:hypothetical protein